MKSDFGGKFSPSIDVSFIANDIIALDVVVAGDEFDHSFEFHHKDFA